MKVEPNDLLQRISVCFQLSRMAATGREATDNSSDSLRESRRCIFDGRF